MKDLLKIMLYGSVIGTFLLAWLVFVIKILQHIGAL